MSKHSVHSKLWCDFAKLCLTAIFILLILFVFQEESIRYELSDLQALRDNLQGTNIIGGTLASMTAFLFGSSLLIGIGLPRIWVSTIAGAIYGSILGSCLALVAAILGAAIIYKLGETFLSTFFLNRVAGKIENWAQRFRENAFWWVLYIRLFPFANASVTGILCACCKVPFRAYLAGSALGFVPLTIIFSTLGSAGVSGSYSQIALGFGLLALSMAVRYIINRNKKMTGPPSKHQAA